MNKTPLMLVKERFETKAKLVEAVGALATEELWLDRVNSVKGLAKVSNEKLLRLHAVLTTVKEKFGTRAKLIAATLELEKREKDAGYKSRLEGYATPRLLDLHGSLSRSAKRAAKRAEVKPAPAKPAAKVKTSRSKKAQAKAKKAA